jgi:glycosyltransferase involved in cell wall biosynthesis
LAERRLRALVVSYAFPPWGEVGALRVFNFCRRLPQFGVDPVVLTVREENLEVRDSSITLPSDLPVIRTGVITNPLDWYRRMRPEASASSGVRGSLGEDSSEIASFLRKNILAALHIPDRYWGWYFPALRATRELLEREKVDVLISSGPPWIPHVIARSIKRRYGIPWLADFRDPWSKLSHGNVTRPNWWNRLAEKMEAGCVRDADLVICNTQRFGDGMRDAYPALNPKKFRVLNNGYDDSASVRPVTDASASEKLLLHLGSLYGERRIDTFLLAIANLVKTGRLRSEATKVLFQGDMDAKYVAEATRLVPELVKRKVAEFRPRVPFDEARKLLWKSNLLLLFQGSHSLQLPAKFYEYLQTGIPIFAVCDAGALTDVIEATGAGVWVTAQDSDSIAEELLKALEMPRRTSEEVTQSSAAYQYSSLSRTLSEWMQEVAAEQGPQ